MFEPWRDAQNVFFCGTHEGSTRFEPLGGYTETFHGSKTSKSISPPMNGHFDKNVCFFAFLELNENFGGVKKWKIHALYGGRHFC